MAKYIIDLDSFLDCLDFLSLGIVNGHDYTYIKNVKSFVEKFPRDEYIDNATTYREA